MGGVAHEHDLVRIHPQGVEHRPELLGAVEGIAEQRHSGVPAEAGQLGVARPGMLVRADRPLRQLPHHRLHPGEGLRPVHVVGIQVVVERDPQAGALGLEDMAEGDRMAGHTEGHEGRGQSFVGVDERAVEIEHRDRGHASVWPG